MHAVDSPDKQPRRGLGESEVDEYSLASASNRMEAIMVGISCYMDCCIVMVSTKGSDVMSNA